MQQLFVENGQVHNGSVCITGQDALHIGRVLRMKPGERIRVSDGDGRSYFCRITKIEPDCVYASVEETDEVGTEPPYRVFLYQGLPKGDKMETIVQKAVELGVYSVTPVAMKNCVVKLDEKKAENKCRRWQAIAESAAKQAKRTRIPQVLAPVSWTEALRRASEQDIVLVPYENERGMDATREVIRSIPAGASAAVLIGPEGGFAPEEIAAVTEPMKRISLGRRILRTETAGPALLSMLLYEWDL